MSKLKEGTGESTEHKDNRQNERGAGVHNEPLRKSGFQPEPPNVDEGKSHAASSPKMAAQAKEKAGTHLAKGVIGQYEIKPHEGNTAKTFRAPRKEGGHDALEAGYTKLGKA